MQRPPLGAFPDPRGTRFTAWSPQTDTLTLLLGDGREIGLEQAGGGYFTAYVEGVEPGHRYSYRLGDNGPFPDPASRFQPEGVHEPSEVVDARAYRWQDHDWDGVAQRDLVFYELHVGTFTPEGTFAAASEKLAHLAALGVTAVELMPVADFPGSWNWGYDHAALYAPSCNYGSPDDLRAFVDAAHHHGLAVYLDVIYNHLGPDGAYVAAFGPMFTDRHHTPWGQAINLDDTHSEGVRHLFIDNALHWLREYHVDGLRLDATHALRDDSRTHFLAELAAAVDALEDWPPRHLFAEDHRNEGTLVRPRSDGGYGLDGVWADDLHHLVRHQTAGDSEGYFADFAGTTADDLAACLRQGWYYTGQYAEAFGEERGTDPSDVRPDQCVVCIQNHDQVGNRPLGDRLSETVTPAQYRAASALLLFAPELPLLFMGQEWMAGTPFQYFTDHEAELGRQVSEGRRSEFEDFEGFGGDVPDPQDPATFERSKLDWSELETALHAKTLALYRRLLALRRELPGDFGAEAHGDRGLVLQRGNHVLLVALDGDVMLPLPEDVRVLFHTEEDEFAADGIAPDVRDGTIRFPAAAALATLRM